MNSVNSLSVTQHGFNNPLIRKILTKFFQKVWNHKDKRNFDVLIHVKFPSFDANKKIIPLFWLTTVNFFFSQYISYAFLLNHFTWLSALIFGTSFLAFLVIDLVYNSLQDYCPYLEYWSMHSMAYQPLVYLNSKSANFWTERTIFSVVLIVVISCLPRVVYVIAGHILCKDDVQRHREGLQKTK